MNNTFICVSMFSMHINLYVVCAYAYANEYEWFISNENQNVFSSKDNLIKTAIKMP